MKLSNKALGLLQKVVVLNGWYVCADNIVEAGRLIEAGYATAYDESYEGTHLTATENGAAFMLRKQLIRRSTAEELAIPYSRAYTFVGEKWFEDTL